MKFPADPESGYGWSKLIGEIELNLAVKGTHTRLTVLDLHNVYGWPCVYNNHTAQVIPSLIYKALKSTDKKLVVWGNGKQGRAFIHIQDTVKCIQLALENAPKSGEPVHIFNQVTETFRVRDLAELVAQLTGTPVQRVDNPRIEADENELEVENEKFMKLGLDPITLSEGLLMEIKQVAEKYSHRCDKDKIMPKSKWRN